MGISSGMEKVWESVFHEGVNTPTQQFMNWSFYGLFATLTALLIGSGGNAHVFAFLGLSICLFFSVNWFIAELERSKSALSNSEVTKKID